jgi:putative endonuclease
LRQCFAYALSPARQHVRHVRQYHVYMLACNSRVLYIGATSRLQARVAQHRARLVDGFSKQYNTTQLVWFEECSDAYAMVSRERQLKAWSRVKKVALIQRMNPEWRDLYDEL